MTSSLYQYIIPLYMNNVLFLFIFTLSPPYLCSASLQSSYHFTKSHSDVCRIVWALTHLSFCLSLSVSLSVAYKPFCAANQQLLVFSDQTRELENEEWSFHSVNIIERFSYTLHLLDTSDKYCHVSTFKIKRVTCRKLMCYHGESRIVVNKSVVVMLFSANVISIYPAHMITTLY